MGGVVALKATWFLSLGLVKSGDMLTMAGKACGKGREFVWVATLAVVGPVLFSVIVGLSNV